MPIETTVVMEIAIVRAILVHVVFRERIILTSPCRLSTAQYGLISLHFKYSIDWVEI